MKREKDYHLSDPTWCPGCGIYGLFAALKMAAGDLDLGPEETVMVTGIGCHGRLNNHFRSYGFHALHGRTLPLASGIKLANPRLSVLSISGDGDAYSIGVGHFVHALRKNIDITYLVVDNRIYALTQGQTSPTTPLGHVSVSAPFGTKELPLDGPRLALASGGTFIARGFSGHPKKLAVLIKKGIQHKGFSFIEVLSPCVTHNKIISAQWFKEHISPLDEDPGYDPRSRKQAGEKLIKEDKIPVGLIYAEERATYGELVLPESDHPLVGIDLDLDVKKFEGILDGFQ